MSLESHLTTLFTIGSYVQRSRNGICASFHGIFFEFLFLVYFDTYFKGLLEQPRTIALTGKT